jgi:hypothetical protein
MYKYMYYIYKEYGIENQNNELPSPSLIPM